MDPDLSVEQFGAAPVSMVENGSEWVCVRRADGEAVRISLSEADALQQASEMKPFAEHAALLCERDIGQFLERMARRFRISSVRASRISQTFKEWRAQGSISTYGALSKKRTKELSELIGKGLLVSNRQLLAKLQSGQTAPEPDVRIRHLCVPTANRPERLARCLKSFQDNLQKNGRDDATIFVIEDWEDPSNKQVVERARANSRVRVEHLGLQHRKTMIDALVKRTGVPPEVVRFGLSPDTSMPARNAFTLMTAGNYIFQTDDDTSCAYASITPSADTTVIASTNEPCEGWFYPDHDRILRERPLDRDLDILGAHEKLVGKSVASALQHTGKVGWKHVTPDLVTTIQDGGSRIEMTATGCLGDSGLYSSGGYVVASTDETIARMSQSAESYEIAVRSGKILRVPLNPVVSRGEYFQGMSYAVDNTRVHPPYFPMGRNGDGVGAVLCLLSDTQSWICHLPWAIYHQSDADRKPYFVEHTEQFSRLRLCDVVIYALRSAAPPAPAKREQGLAFMGEHLVTLGELPPNAFKSYVRGEFTRNQVGTIRFLENRLLSLGNKYPLWEKDVRTIQANVQRSLTDESAIIPVDLEVEVGAASALEVAQKAIKSYGQLLCVWEELFTESRNMMQQAA